MKKIAIVGAGAIGSIMGAFLTKGGADVIMVDPYKEHMDKIAQDGLVVNYPDGKKEVVNIKTSYSAENIGVMDIVIIQTKTTFTDEALKGAKNAIGKNTTVGTFQNGLGNPEKIAEYVPKENVFYGCLNISSRILSPGQVLGNVFGDVNIYAGSMEYNQKQLEANLYLKETFGKGGITYSYSQDADTHVWTKALLNISGNALHGLVRLKPIITADDENAMTLIEKITDEVCAVAEAKEIKGIDGKKFLSGLHKVYKSDLGHHWASTAQDMLFTKKETEIDSLNGAIVKIGESLGIKTPFNEAITLLVRTIQNHYDSQFQENSQ